MQNQQILLNAKQAAQLLDVSRDTFWRWRKNPEFPAPVSIGRARRWNREQLLRFAQQPTQLQ